jgi:hypothetical protein
LWFDRAGDWTGGVKRKIFTRGGRFSRLRSGLAAVNACKYWKFQLARLKLFGPSDVKKQLLKTHYLLWCLMSLMAFVFYYCDYNDLYDLSNLTVPVIFSLVAGWLAQYSIVIFVSRIRHRKAAGDTNSLPDLEKLI